MEIKLEKHEVCKKCLGIGVIDVNCDCLTSHYWKSIILEFEVCSHCGNPITDGEPADTEFNKKQLNE